MQRKLMLQTSDLTRRQLFYQRQNKSTQESTVMCLSWKEVEAADDKALWYINNRSRQKLTVSMCILLVRTNLNHVVKSCCCICFMPASERNSSSRKMANDFV